MINERIQLDKKFYTTFMHYAIRAKLFYYNVYRELDTLGEHALLITKRTRVKTLDRDLSTNVDLCRAVQRENRKP